MNILKNFSYSHTTAIFAIALLMSSCALTMFPANAQIASSGGEPTGTPNGSILLPAGVTPDMTMTPTAYLSFRPNPVGVNQLILVNLWLTDSPSQTRYFSDFKVTFTKPDGTTDVLTLNSYYADGTAWFEYKVDQIGEWKVKFEFPGGYFPPGNYTTNAVQNALAFYQSGGGGTAATGVTEIYTRSVYYLPASTEEQTLTVQSNQVLSWPPATLPTDYWTRPVSAMNREWAPILGDFPWFGPASGVNSYNWPADTSKYQVVQRNTGSFTPYVQAPNTAHIVWKRLGALSGIVGGDNSLASGTTGGGTPTIIFQGRCYQVIAKVSASGPTSQNYWQCYDLRTGQIYWERPVYVNETIPTAIEYSKGTPEIPGAEAAADTVTASLVAIGNNRLVKYDPFTGAANFNISIPTFAQSTYYMNSFVLSVQTINATAWRLINWTTTTGTSTDFSSRIASNISFARNNVGMYQDWDAGLCYVNREPNSWDATGLNAGPSTPNIAYDNATGIRYGSRTLIYSLVTGQLLYNITTSYDPYPEDSPYNQVSNIADHGKFGILMRAGSFWVYDGQTGTLLYKTEKMDYPWDQPSFGAYACASAYGLFYRFGYSQIYAFNWTNGKIVWKYQAPAFSATESPYTGVNGTTVYSWGAGSTIADGKIYCYNSEHTPSQPITRGWGIHCLNATTGELLWKLKTPMIPGAVADGYITASSYDGYMYVFGKGQSTTTVTAPDTAILRGNTLVIKGTVMDLSPAQPNTPCVSAESMTTQMEYKHMQQPINGIWHNETVNGVPVTLTALDSNGNYEDLGTVTTDGYYGTFAKTWTPPIEGDYKIIASFAGDDSYGSSGASTAITVVPAPTSTNTEQPQQIIIPDYTITIIGGIIAVIIAVALVGIILYRKK